MRYVIYNEATGMSEKRCPNERGAKISLAALRKRELKQPENRRRKYAILPEDRYESEINIMVERTNLMTGKTFWEKLDTPSYCSPSSESYWSM